MSFFTAVRLTWFLLAACCHEKYCYGATSTSSGNVDPLFEKMQRHFSPLTRTYSNQMAFCIPQRKIPTASFLKSDRQNIKTGFTRTAMVPFPHFHVKLGIQPKEGRWGSSMIVSYSSSKDDEEEGINFDSLMDMDIVLYRRREKVKEEEPSVLELGALQEDGTLAPLSAWTMESAFSGETYSIEFLVDEEDRFPGLNKEDVIIVSLLEESLIGYGSRQVNGGMGPGNPHGEESELLYYVDRRALRLEDHDDDNDDDDDDTAPSELPKEDRIKIVLNPELEIFW